MWCGVSYIVIGSITSDGRVAWATGSKDKENERWQDRETENPGEQIEPVTADGLTYHNLTLEIKHSLRPVCRSTLHWQRHPNQPDAFSASDERMARWFSEAHTAFRIWSERRTWSHANWDLIKPVRSWWTQGGIQHSNWFAKTFAYSLISQSRRLKACKKSNQ